VAGGTFVFEHEIKQMDFTKWLHQTDLQRSCPWRGLPPASAERAWKNWLGGLEATRLPKSPRKSHVSYRLAQKS